MLIVFSCTSRTKPAGIIVKYAYICNFGAHYTMSVANRTWSLKYANI